MKTQEMHRQGRREEQRGRLMDAVKGETGWMDGRDRRDGRQSKVQEAERKTNDRVL